MEQAIENIVNRVHLQNSEENPDYLDLRYQIAEDLYVNEGLLEQPGENNQWPSPYKLHGMPGKQGVERYDRKLNRYYHQKQGLLFRRLGELNKLQGVAVDASYNSWILWYNW